MMRFETENIILRPLLKTETAIGGNCCISAAVFDCGGKEGCFAVIAKENRQIIGTVLCPEEAVSIHIAENSRDRGYGGEALALALDVLFGVYGRKRVTAVCDRDNVFGVKLLLHCGLEKEKTENSLCFWSLTAERWELL